jgi:hypothetical protein
MIGHVARIGTTRTAYKVLVGKPEGGRPLGTLDIEGEHYVNGSWREIRWGGLDWMHVLQDRD